MNQINPTSSATTAPSGATNPLQSDPLLGKDAFLSLLTTQLKEQDPLSPSQDPSQFVGELAQYTTLEQETNIAQSSSQAAAQQSASTSILLLGHTVTYVDANGVNQSGLVQQVDFGGSGPTLTVAGVSGIDPGSVIQVS